MLYEAIRPVAKLGLQVFFRKIHIKNRDFVPQDKPLLLVANHPTGFLEPCLLACWLPQPLHSITRGDMFQKPFVARILNQLYMIPIFRFQDGFSNLKQNQEIMDKCYRVLHENKTILIFSEGRCLHEKRLRNIQKGTARMAFGALEKYNEQLDIHISPVGLNYTYAELPRREVMIEFGAPIRLADYLPTYHENPNRAIKELTEKIEQRLKKLVIHINETDDENLLEQQFILNRNDFPTLLFPPVAYTNTRRKIEHRIADAINDMPSTEKNILKTKSNAYFEELNFLKISDFGVAQPQFYHFGTTLSVILGFLPYLLGKLGHWLPLKYTQNIVTQRVKSIEFKSSVFFGTALGSILLYYITLILLGFFLQLKWYWLIVCSLPFFGYFSLLYADFFERWQAAKAIKQLDLNLLKKIQTVRQSIRINYSVNQFFETKSE